MWLSMDMSQYLDIFLEESGEHLQNLSQKLLELEQHPDDLAIINEIFRSAHTLKGMSSTMGFEDMADLTHHMENVLEDLKEGRLRVSTLTVDVLLKCLDRLQSMIDSIRGGGSPACDNSDLIDMLGHIKGGGKVGVEQENTVPDPMAHPVDETGWNGFCELLNDYDLDLIQEAFNRRLNVFYIQVVVSEDCQMKSVRAFMVFKALEEDGEIIKSEPPAQELDEGRFGEEFQIILVTGIDEVTVISRLHGISEIKVGEIMKLDPSMSLDSLDMVEGTGDVHTSGRQEERSDSAPTSAQEVSSTRRIRQTVRVDIRRLDDLMNLVGELVINKGRLEQIGSSEKLTELNETIEQVDRITTDLQSVVMKVRMVPIKQVFNRFPRMVRDLTHELGKEVEFHIEGEETELDRTVIDEIGDPLVHLLRNAIDHGIEVPEERARLGKPRKALLKLTAHHEGNNVFIEVTDDGRGIDVNKIKEQAVSKGLIEPVEAEHLEGEAALALLFRPGFSTSEAISDISGRGVGLDVVKTRIGALNGEIAIGSQKDKGTTFRIRLPLTLAIIQALMVEVGDELYAIPLGSVDETTMLQENEIKMVQNQEVALLRGGVLPLASLHQLLDTPGQLQLEEENYIVVVRKGDKQYGLVCDNLVGQQEVVIKSLGKLLTGTSGLAGATILGNGKVALILDVNTLL
jgi:two-component system chemotaxis sensor kinase CheA